MNRATLPSPLRSDPFFSSDDSSPPQSHQQTAGASASTSESPIQGGSAGQQDCEELDEEDGPPPARYRIHLHFFTNEAPSLRSSSASAIPAARAHVSPVDSAPAQHSAPASAAGGGPSATGVGEEEAELPEDWREELRELRQAGAFFVPPPSSDLFRPLGQRKKRRGAESAAVDLAGLSELPKAHTKHIQNRASAGETPQGQGQEEKTRGGYRPARVVDQRFGPIEIDWADHLAGRAAEAEARPDAGNMTGRREASGSGGSSAGGASGGGGSSSSTVPLPLQPPPSAASAVSMEQQQSQASTSSGTTSASRRAKGSSVSNGSGSGGNAAAASSSSQSAAEAHRRAGGSSEAFAPVARFYQTSSFSTTNGDAASAAGPTTLAERERAAQRGEQLFEVGSTDVAFGIVHLFRDRTEGVKHGSKQAEVVRRLAETGQAVAAGQETELGTVLAVVGCPSQMTAAQFLEYVEPAADAISHLRMIRCVGAVAVTVLELFLLQLRSPHTFPFTLPPLDSTRPAQHTRIPAHTEK